MPVDFPWVQYENGNYTVTLNLIDGTKIRETGDDWFDAAMPESMDVKLSNRCHRGCAFCHENSKPDGKTASLEFAEDVVSTMHPWTEVAVGGGNLMEDMAHTERFLRMLEKRRCVPSLTLHQEDFLDNLDIVDAWRREHLVFGIGVSLSDAGDERLVPALLARPTAVLHTIVGLIDEEDVAALEHRGLKLLLLGYKDVRRGIAYRTSHGAEVSEKMAWLKGNLPRVMKGFKVCSFDNLALEQLPVREAVGEMAWEQFYMGDDGQHTFYMDLVERQYAKSSTSMERFDITGSDGEIRSVDDMFAHIKGLE